MFRLSRSSSMAWFWSDCQDALSHITLSYKLIPFTQVQFLHACNCGRAQVTSSTWTIIYIAFLQLKPKSKCYFKGKKVHFESLRYIKAKPIHYLYNEHYLQWDFVHETNCKEPWLCLVIIEFPCDDPSQLFIWHKHNEIPACYSEEARYTPLVEHLDPALFCEHGSAV